MRANDAALVVMAPYPDSMTALRHLALHKLLTFYPDKILHIAAFQLFYFMSAWKLNIEDLLRTSTARVAAFFGAHMSTFPGPCTHLHALHRSMERAGVTFDRTAMSTA